MTTRNFFLCLFACFASIAAAVLFPACTAGDVFNQPNFNRITVMTYNTQTFFDAVEDGGEFAEFIGPKSLWSEALYVVRLDRLRETLLLCGRVSGMGPDRGPDIVVLQEIENERVVRDICNRLPLRGSYPNAVFVPSEKGSAFGTAVLTRYQVESVTVHSTGETGEALRPLLQIRLKTGDAFLELFAVHWKSKMGTSDTSSIRLLQEKLLAERIARLEVTDPDIPFLACGDFNQTRSEFTVLNVWANCWDVWLAECGVAGSAGPPGSYYYQNKWETIDNVFYSASLSDETALDIAGFQVVAAPPLVTGSGLPARFNLTGGGGYSDHLPLVVELKRMN